ncbi:MAG: YjbQ family protein [bacterium]|nr:MAG: YjbQ family protein [bacterium]
MAYSLRIQTQSQTEFVDITNQIQRVVSESRIQNGLCHIFVPHTTAAITINENADPSVRHDIVKELNKIIPFQDNYHHMEGNSAAHIKSSLLGVSLHVIVENSRLLLGTWQGIYFCEFDGPRNRTVWIKILADRT